MSYLNRKKDIFSVLYYRSIKKFPLGNNVVFHNTVLYLKKRLSKGSFTLSYC